jgi:uncharacterized protein
MKVTNQTKQTTLAEKIIIPKTLLDQSLGLLKYSKPTAMLLKTHFGVHTFGMRYPIDVLILDKQNTVVALKENLKPNRVFFWNFKYETILELPEGTIKKTKTEIEDIILFNK